MYVHHKFGLFLIFILSLSTCTTRADPGKNQTSSSVENDYDDSYDDDYYDDDENVPPESSNSDNVRLTSATASSTASSPSSSSSSSITTTHNPELFLVPKRSNHVLEPSCPYACLCLEDNKFIKCSTGRLTRVPHDLPTTALIIDLSGNRIEQLNAIDFANCTKVLEINLNGNQLTSVPREAFEMLPYLQRLRLANNHLTDIDPDTFAANQELNILDLSNNTITLLPEGSFLNRMGLLEFFCRNCSWSELYDETFSNMSSLTSLKLDLNDFHKKINTKAFTPLRNLIKLRLPELEPNAVTELCNLLQTIDNISFKHFDVTCFELVAGSSFNESVIFATNEPRQEAPSPSLIPTQQTSTTTGKGKKMTSNSSVSTGGYNETATNILSAGFVVTVPPTEGSENNDSGAEKPYQVPISQEAIHIMLIAILIIAIVGIIIGFICRKDVGGIKTKCCRTSQKPEVKDQTYPAEEIPLNKLA